MSGLFKRSVFLISLSAYSCFVACWPALADDQAAFDKKYYQFGQDPLMEPFFREGIFIDELDRDMQRERRALRLRQLRKQQKLDDEADDERSAEKFTEDFGRDYRQDFVEKFAPETFGDDDDKPDAMQADGGDIDKKTNKDEKITVDRDDRDRSERWQMGGRKITLLDDGDDDDRRHLDADDKQKDRGVIRGSLGEIKGPIQEMPWDWLPDKFDPLDNGGFSTSPDNGSPVPYRLNGHPDLERGRPWDKDWD